MDDGQEPVPALLTPGRRLKIQRHTVDAFSCPKCERDMNVTGVKEGHTVTCSECDNVTVVPAYNPKWWFKPLNYVVSLGMSFAAGILAGIVLNLLR